MPNFEGLGLEVGPSLLGFEKSCVSNSNYKRHGLQKRHLESELETDSSNQ